MGPSGAGKTTLISALTLDAFYGKPSGTVTLNGEALTDKIFKEHCYVVKQQDKHWAYLTCRETLLYAAELYEIAAKSDIAILVDEVISKMGLDVCKDTRCARLSGGQRRRLSIGIALLKQPTLLFLDEPTSGLDAAAATNIMQEIVRVAKEERLIILCTIHQPSTKIYNAFDQVMILSKGREAFSGDVGDAIPYFDSIGYPCPPATNPAEFFLDLVNADFSDEAAVDNILDTWEEKRPEAGHSSHHKKGFGRSDTNESDVQEGVAEGYQTNLMNEITIMFRRCGLLIVRDPILYIGRCLIFFFSCLIFSFVYWRAREYTQDQAQNKMWINIWFVGVPSNMGVVAVYALNDEFKSIVREAKNGMVGSISYVFSKFFLVLPIMFVYGLCSLGIPGYVIQDFEGSSFGLMLVLYACVMYVFEALAECISVWVEDPIFGMLSYMNYWCGSFLFAGFLIPVSDMYWPFEIFYYVMPYQYYVRTAIFLLFRDATFDSCIPAETDRLPCITNVTDPVDGTAVLDELSLIYPLLENEDHIARDIGVLIAISAFFKICYIIGVVKKTSQVVDIHEKTD